MFCEGTIIADICVAFGRSHALDMATLSKLTTSTWDGSYFLYLIDGEIEAQKGGLTCPELHS